ncbi:MAG: enoyl-CoA hydratase/isomerase family protein [Desulfatibacillaceae bacterium]
MAIVEYGLDGKVAVVSLNEGENRFNPDFLEAYIGVLDEIENDTEANVLVVRSNHEKIFSNGLDLEWIMGRVAEQDADTLKKFFYRLNDFFKRTLLYPMPTIAAINGHCFAGGAIWSCAFDFRFMRTDRGFFCFPEVDISIPFLPGMLALMKKSIPGPTLVELCLTGTRLDARQCVDAGIMRDCAHVDELMDKVLEFARAQDKRRIVVQEIKKELYKEVARVIDQEDPPLIESGRLQV